MTTASRSQVSLISLMTWGSILCLELALTQIPASSPFGLLAGFGFIALPVTLCAGLAYVLGGGVLVIAVLAVTAFLAEFALLDRSPVGLELFAWALGVSVVTVILDWKGLLK